MTDIVERLRDFHEHGVCYDFKLIADAAEEIERLRAALRQAKEVLEWIEESEGNNLYEEKAEIDAALLNQCRKDDDQDNIDRQHKGPSVK